MFDNDFRVLAATHEAEHDKESMAVTSEGKLRFSLIVRGKEG